MPKRTKRAKRPKLDRPDIWTLTAAEKRSLESMTPTTRPALGKFTDEEIASILRIERSRNVPIGGAEVLRQMQPYPLQTIVSRIDSAGELALAHVIVRRWRDDDVRRCHLCPICGARFGTKDGLDSTATCVVVVGPSDGRAYWDEARHAALYQMPVDTQVERVSGQLMTDIERDYGDDEPARETPPE